jgi:23S rRNA (uracil1939-C5)-methyltransferase
MAIRLTIEKLVYGGSGMGRHDGKVVFLPFSIPGDHVEAEVRVDKKRYVVAELKRILQPGSGRRDAPCPYFGNCGGCGWQQLEYPKQVACKRQILEDLIRHRFPEAKDLLIGIKASPMEFGYRSRARIQIRRRGDRHIFGFYRHQSHGVQDINDCLLLRPTLNVALSTLRGWQEAALIDIQSGEIDLICNEEGQEWKWSRASERFRKKPPKKNAIRDLCLRRSVAGFQYLVSPSVFFQANDFMIHQLVGIVDRLCGTSEGKHAVDLFAGVGLFSLPLSQKFRKITAVESSPQASLLCEHNRACAGIDNVAVASKDARSWLKEFRESPERADVVIMNPPRRGVGQEVMQLLGECEPDIIVYVACDPNTLVRDVQFLLHPYRIDFVQALDLFPQTFHFETILVLRRS